MRPTLARPPASLTRRTREHRTREHSREAGSAYVVALVVLFIVTLLGLSLTLVTQTEFQIGANERLVTRVFYGADSGVSSAIARALVRSDHSGQVLNLTDTGADFTGGTLLGVLDTGESGTRVEVSPFYPILDVPCNLCEVNNAGTYSGRDYRKVNHAVTAIAQRFVTFDQGVTRRTLAEKALTTMIEVQPWRVPIQAYDPIDKASELEKIKF